MNKEKVIENVKIITEYDIDEMLLNIYYDKLAIQIMDYCNIEELNAPLYNLLESMLIRIFNYIGEEKTKNKDKEDVKSIQRGDTTITFKDDKNKLSLEDVMRFRDEDYAILNIHRKVRWSR